MNSQAMRGLVTGVTRVSSTVSKIQVRLSHGLKYQPGQSLWISPLSERLITRGLTGFYELCGCPETALRTNQYEFLAETNPILGLIRGLGQVKVGDFLKVEGPFGTFMPLSVKTEEWVVWIATPGKLGPFLSCIQSRQFQLTRPRRIILLVETPQRETVPFKELFESHGISVISGVTQALLHEKFKLNFKKSRFFVSADKPLLREVWSTLIHKKGVVAGQIIYLGQSITPASLAEKLRERTVEQSKAA